MSRFNCPHCKQPAFSAWDKYLAAKWKILTCPHCERRVISLPLLLAAYYLLYLADVLDLSLIAYLAHNIWYLVAMVIFWVILDLFSLYLPLAALRPAAATQRKEMTTADPDTVGQNA
jgi:hypothetical protein